MINLILAMVTTTVVYILTILTVAIHLPIFTTALIFMVSYLFIKEIKYEVGK